MGIILGLEELLQITSPETRKHLSREGSREVGREGGREGGIEGGIEGGREGGRELKISSEPIDPKTSTRMSTLPMDKYISIRYYYIISFEFPPDCHYCHYYNQCVFYSYCSFYYN